MFESWFWVTAPLALFMGIGLLIYSTGRRKGRPEQGKDETYACGEDMPDITVQADNFYQAIRKTFRLKRMRELHTGNVSDYLLWLLVGLTVILLVVAYI